MRSISKRTRLRELIAAGGWSEVGEAEWNALAAAIPKLTPSDMKHAGIAVQAPWSGVAQKTFDELEASLCAFSEVYAARPDLRRFCRAVVIGSKDRARLASRNGRVTEEKRKAKAEMLEWMLVWLSDPAIFPTWVHIRRGPLDPHMLKQEPMDEKRVKCDVCVGTGQCTACKGTSNGGQCFNCAGTGHCPQCQGTGKRKAEHVK